MVKEAWAKKTKKRGAEKSAMWSEEKKSGVRRKRGEKPELEKENERSFDLPPFGFRSTPDIKLHQFYAGKRSIICKNKKAS